MTFWDLLATVWRHRLVALLGFAITAAAAFHAASPVEAWNGQISVVFLAPEGSKGNALAPTTGSLIATAGIVSRSVNGANDEPKTVSADLTLASLGINRGWSVRQPNAGGQWDIHYEEPRLDVMATGHTAEEASAQISEAVDSIESALRHIQDEGGVRSDQRIRTQLSPAAPVLTRQSGSRSRAVSATVIAGLAITVAAVLGAQRLHRRRKPGA